MKFDDSWSVIDTGSSDGLIISIIISEVWSISVVDSNLRLDPSVFADRLVELLLHKVCLRYWGILVHVCYYGLPQTVCLSDYRSFNGFAQLWRKPSNLGRNRKRWFRLLSTEGLLDFESLEKLYQVPRVGQGGGWWVSEVAVIRSGVNRLFWISIPPKIIQTVNKAEIPLLLSGRGEWFSFCMTVRHVTKIMELKLILRSQPRLASRHSFLYWLPDLY